MKIVLLIPPATALHRDEPISAPLGVAYLAAVLEADHHTVTILDAATLAEPQQIAGGRWQIGLDVVSLAQLTATLKPDLVGVSCPFTTRYGPFKRLVAELKKTLHGIPIIAGGTHPTIFPETVLKENALECVVTGESEETLALLVDGFATTGKIDLTGLEGVTFQQNGEFINSPRKNYTDNLDRLPFPARHLLNIDAYLSRSGGRWASRNKSILSILTSRSCAGRCSFCSIHAVFGPKWRGRSPENVVAEVDEVTSRYSPSLIAFEDDRLTTDRDRLMKICEAIAGLRQKVNWFTPNGVHVADLDDELLKLMHESGCKSLNLAIESGDPDMLQKTIGKKANQTQAREIANACNRIGIRTNGYFVVGMPGESEASLERSLAFCLSLPLDGLGVFIATPFPGTRMFDECAAKGYIDPASILETYYESADAELFHQSLFETPTMSRDRLIWWSERFKADFRRGLYNRRPLVMVKDWIKRAQALAGVT